MKQIMQFATEFGIGGTLCIGLLALKSKKKLIANDPIFDRTQHLKKSPLSHPISSMRDLRCDDDLRLLLEECEKLITLTSDTKSAGGQFMANRLACTIEKLCNRMCDEAKRSGDPERIDAAIRAMQDYIPNIRDICSTYLQNMLL